MIYCDKKSSILMTKNLVFHGRTKNIELQQHFIREQIILDTIEVKFCLRKDRFIDGFRQALNHASFIKLQDVVD